MPCSVEHMDFVPITYSFREVFSHFGNYVLPEEFKFMFNFLYLLTAVLPICKVLYKIVVLGSKFSFFFKKLKEHRIVSFKLVQPTGIEPAYATMRLD